jgi:ABC-2 type transport system permease protein
MKYVRIFLLHFQRVFEQRSRSFVFFIGTILNPLLLILFWSGAQYTNAATAKSWPAASRNTYYFFLMIAATLLIAHVEEDVSGRDIKDGRLSIYLIKPFSYYWQKFLSEISYRILQAAYGVVGILIVIALGVHLSFSSNIYIILLSIAMMILAYFLSFTYKMLLGLCAFWITDMWGIFQIAAVLFTILAGIIMPIYLLPNWMQVIAYIFPFAYIIYFPVQAVQGNLSIQNMFYVLSVQLFWLFLMRLLYIQMWNRGVKKFTGLGQ